jgi:OFA family oxalate/formate antiporter-like MFS transporter
MMGGGFNTIGVFFDPLMREFHWTHAQVSLFATVIVMAMALMGPVAGILLEKFEARLVMIPGVIIAAFGFLLASHATTYWTMTIVYILEGVGIGLAGLTPCAVVIGRSFEGSDRGAAMGIAMSGNGFGGLLMIMVAGIAIAHLGWRGAYMVLAAPMLFVALPLLLLFIHVGPHRTMEPSAVIQEEGVDLGEAVQSRSFWAIYSMVFLYGFAVSIPLIHAIPYLIHLGYRPERAATAMATFQGIVTVGTISLGALVDRFGGRTVIAVGALIAGASLKIFLGAAQLVSLLVFLLLFGLTANATAVVPALLLAECFGMKRYAFLSGLAMFTTLFSVSLGALAAGWLVDRTAEYSSAIIVGAIAFVCAAMLAAAIPQARFRVAKMPLHA